MNGSEIARQRDSQRWYVHTDVLGSPTAISDETKKLVGQKRYEPYGVPFPTFFDDGLGFGGHYTDGATQLSYLQQRYYDPYAGRLNSVDPAHSDFHRYAYAGNNPYKNIDPDGRDYYPYYSASDRVQTLAAQQELGGNYTAAAAITLANDIAVVATNLITGIKGAGTGNYTNPYTDHVLTADERIGAPIQAGALAVPFLRARNVVIPEISISAARFPESAAHIADAQAAGHPEILTINRAGAAANRRAALEGKPSAPGFDRDEYPPAMFQEGGLGASVRYITPADNRGAGSCMGLQCRGLPDGARVRIRVEEEP